MILPGGSNPWERLCVQRANLPRPGRCPVAQSREDLQPGADDVPGFLALDMGHQADAAGVTLGVGVVILPNQDLNITSLLLSGTQCRL